jgi:hypothetical protein
LLYGVADETVTWVGADMAPPPGEMTGLATVDNSPKASASDDSPLLASFVRSDVGPFSTLHAAATIRKIKTEGDLAAFMLFLHCANARNPDSDDGIG